MIQEQLNLIVDTYNEARMNCLKEGRITHKDTVEEEMLAIILSSMTCYLSVYKDLYPDTYETAKNVLQDLADMFTIGIDVETGSTKEGEFSLEKQHLIYVGD